MRNMLRIFQAHFSEKVKNTETQRKFHHFCKKACIFVRTSNQYTYMKCPPGLGRYRKNMNFLPTLEIIYNIKKPHGRVRFALQKDGNLMINFILPEINSFQHSTYLVLGGANFYRNCFYKNH